MEKKQRGQSLTFHCIYWLFNRDRDPYNGLLYIPGTSLSSIFGLQPILSILRGSMGLVYLPNICCKYQPNVGMYSIHGSYEIAFAGCLIGILIMVYYNMIPTSLSNLITYIPSTIIRVQFFIAQLSPPNFNIVGFLCVINHDRISASKIQP